MIELIKSALKCTGFQELGSIGAFSAVTLRDAKHNQEEDIMFTGCSVVALDWRPHQITPNAKVDPFLYSGKDQLRLQVSKTQLLTAIHSDTSRRGLLLVLFA